MLEDIDADLHIINLTGCRVKHETKSPTIRFTTLHIIKIKKTDSLSMLELTPKQI